MSRRMIDEGALNAQIQEATTTKQDKLYTKTNSGITLTEEEGKSYIGSELIYTVQSLNTFPVFAAGTYEVGDIIRTQSFKLNGLYISEQYQIDDQTRLVKIDDVVILRMMIPETSSTGNYVGVEWMVIKGGTITKEKQIIHETYVIIAKNAKRVY